MIKCTFSDPSGIDSTSVVLTLDDEEYTSRATISETTLSYTTEHLSFGSHSISVKIADTLGNIETSTWSFKIQESLVAIEEEIGNLTADEMFEVEPENADETGIGKIDIVSNTNLSNVKVKVAKLQTKPEEVDDPLNKTVYSYLDIILTTDEEDVDEEDIGKMNISFKIEVSWFTTNNVDKNSVTLLRYHNGQWVELTTIYLSEDGTYVYYTAETPGLSTFAIAGTASTDQPVQEIPWIFILIGLIASIGVALVVFLYKNGYIQIER